MERGNLAERRFGVNEEEREKIVKGAFSTLSPMRLARIPAKEKRRVVVLDQLSALFERGREYREREINDILVSVFHDYVTLRRNLIEYGYLDRKRDCSLYWVK